MQMMDIQTVSNEEDGDDDEDDDALPLPHSIHPVGHNSRSFTFW